jgi:Tfp pilus assembly protein PilN
MYKQIIAGLNQLSKINQININQQQVNQQKDKINELIQIRHAYAHNSMAESLTSRFFTRMSCIPLHN